MKIFSMVKYILSVFEKNHTLKETIATSKNTDCYLDTEIDGKTESYFPGGKSTN